MLVIDTTVEVREGVSGPEPKRKVLVCSSACSKSIGEVPGYIVLLFVAWKELFHLANMELQRALQLVTVLVQSSPSSPPPSCERITTTLCSPLRVSAAKSLAIPERPPDLASTLLNGNVEDSGERTTSERLYVPCTPSSEPIEYIHIVSERRNSRLVSVTDTS